MGEAAGADVGVIWEHTPPWNRWGDSLPAGPVTLNDLATIDMFPENISPCRDVGGRVAAQQAVGLDRRGRPAAILTATAKSHLSAADIYPAKTYRVAFGQSSARLLTARRRLYGCPSSSPSPRREDFLTVGSNHMPLRNFRQLPGHRPSRPRAKYIQRMLKAKSRRGPSVRT